MNTILIIAVGIVIAAQWVHLAIRQRGNPRVSVGDIREWHVVGLGMSFACAGLLWLSGLLTTLVHGRGAPQTFFLMLALFFAALGAGLRIAAIERIGRGFSWGTEAPAQLITDGIYRYLKHPLIMGYLLEVWALAYCMQDAVWTAVLMLATFGASACCGIAQALKEEQILRKRFPQEWPDYAARKVL